MNVITPPSTLGDTTRHREDIDRAVNAARRAFNGPWRKFKPYERQALLFKLQRATDLGELTDRTDAVATAGHAAIG